jgi:hypothetical protein
MTPEDRLQVEDRFIDSLIALRNSLREQNADLPKTQTGISVELFLEIPPGPSSKIGLVIAHGGNRAIGSPAACARLRAQLNPMDNFSPA